VIVEVCPGDTDAMQLGAKGFDHDGSTGCGCDVAQR
jgi:hypothetical protein